MKNSKTLSGVEYNEKAVAEGRGYLLGAYNFDCRFIDEQNIELYKKMLENYATKSTRVKNPHFHATISCKGAEYDFEQLQEIGKQWMELMGYGEQPFLIYGHSDTSNNHIHIVSVRIDDTGKKINHSFERLRSQQALEKILGQDIKTQIKIDLLNIKEYKFSSVQQFRTLLESRGYKTRKRLGNVEIIRMGKVQGKIAIAEIEKHITPTVEKDNAARMKQISAWMFKYSVGRSYLEIKQEMKKQFGVDMVFYAKSNKETPYGFAVIDNQNKCVYRGNKIMNIDKVVAIQTKEDKFVHMMNEEAEMKAIQAQCDTIFKELIEKSPRATFAQYQNALQQHKIKLYKNGKIYLSQGGVLAINKEIAKQLRYNDRVAEANSYKARNSEEAFVLAKYFAVKYADVQIDNLSQRDISVERLKEYDNVMEATAIRQDKEALKKYHLKLVNVGNGKVYIMDERYKQMISLDSLHPSVRQKGERNVDYEIKR